MMQFYVYLFKCMLHIEQLTQKATIMMMMGTNMHAHLTHIVFECVYIIITMLWCACENFNLIFSRAIKFVNL